MHGITDATKRDGEQELVEQIDLLERRLRHLGLDGDCAYERAISKLYQALVKKHRNRLEAIRAAGL